MRPHPRIRKTIKWGGMVIAALLAVAWVGSLWFSAIWESSAGGYVSIGSGIISVATPLRIERPSAPGTWWYEWSSYESRWWFEWGTWTGGGYIDVPLWFLMLLPAIPTALAWRLDTVATRRAHIGICPKCSYPRTGLAPSSPCPECGAAAPQG